MKIEDVCAKTGLTDRAVRLTAFPSRKDAASAHNWEKPLDKPRKA